MSPEFWVGDFDDGGAEWSFEALLKGVSFAGNFQFPGPEGYVYWLIGSVGVIRAVPVTKEPEE